MGRETLPQVVVLWQCPRCESYLDDEAMARNHCKLFALFECGSQVCEHLTEQAADDCSWRNNGDRIAGSQRNGDKRG